MPPEDEDTDTKLAILASLFPATDPSTILEILVEADGSVATAIRHLQPVPNDAASEPLDSTPAQPPAKRQKAAGSEHQDDHGRSASAPVPGQQLSIRRFHSGSSPLPPRIRPARKGQTLHLYDPDDIAAHTPCSVIHNFLPASDANDLLQELMQESKTFGKASFQLFERTVSSPHTSSFYVDSAHEQQRQKKEYVYNGSHLTDVRRITPGLARVAGPVEQTVNEQIRQRITAWYPGARKLKYQSAERWKPNCAFVNCYDGGKESVGPHSDQLTYLGPRAVIGSLSLGVAREFRVRKIIPKDEPPLPEGADEGGAEEGAEEGDNKRDSGLSHGGFDRHAVTSVDEVPSLPEARDGSSKEQAFRTHQVSLSSTRKRRASSPPVAFEQNGPRSGKTALATSPSKAAARPTTPSLPDEGGQIAIHLPHNSLLVMHAEMQEEWKHSIAPAQTLVPHPIAGLKRLNVTYRWYRPEFNPRFTPRCRCGVPVVLRCVQRNVSNHGRYMWMCHVNYTPGKEGCGYFKWAEFDDDGRPEWAWDTAKQGEKSRVEDADRVQEAGCDANG